MVKDMLIGDVYMQRNQGKQEKKQNEEEKGKKNQGKIEALRMVG